MSVNMFVSKPFALFFFVFESVDFGLLINLAHVTNVVAADNGSSGRWTVVVAAAAVAAGSAAAAAAAVETRRHVDDGAIGIDDGGSVGDDGCCALANYGRQFAGACLASGLSSWRLVVFVGRCGR